MNHSKKLPRLVPNSADLRCPKWSVPTVLLTLSLLFGWILVIFSQGILPVWAGCLLATVMIYGSFTPMHDACHGAVSRHAWLNEGIGHLCGLMLLAPYAGFRWAHLTHHRYTNVPGKDPDFWSAKGTPFHWATQDIYYYYLILKALRPSSKLTITKKETLTLLVSVVAIGVCLSGFTHFFGTLQVVFLWIIPARLALLFLAFGFDYLPHHPHKVTSIENKFQATRVIDKAWLTPILLSQNYHLIHHLFPSIPFYKYRKVYKSLEPQLIERGITVVK